MPNCSLVAIQSAAEFYRTQHRKRMLRYMQVKQVSDAGQPDQHLKETHKSNIVLKGVDLSCQHVPNSSDFVVYHFKSDDSGRILRFYQCRCDTSKYQIWPMGTNQTSQDKEQLPNEYQTVRKLIKHGMLPSVPSDIFSNSHSSCNKVFRTLSKFYAHLRIHCNEKPYVCPVPECRLGFN